VNFLDPFDDLSDSDAVNPFVAVNFNF